MKRDRDNQRAKLMRAESAVSKKIETKFDNIEDAQKFVDKVTNSAWTKKHYYPQQIHLTQSSKLKHISCENINGEVFTPAKGVSDIQILHALSHQYADNVYGLKELHGWRFAKVYLAMIRHFMGRPAFDLMRKSFDKKGVQYKQHSIGKLSDEQLKAYRTRMKKAREVRLERLAA